MKKPIPFGKYYLLERINVGGMAEVFKAKAFGVEGFERIVAVKRILPNIAEDKEFITMFVDEAKIAVQLNHANVAQIFDLGKVEDSYFIALEFIHGKDLRGIFDFCRTSGENMPVAQACFITMKVCEGLDYAHNKRDSSGRELGLVHRDISPQNVLLSYEGEVKIIDFGIAKAAGKASKTQAGILKGKFGYMSPEQVRGMPLDRRSDIFSLGIVLYELLTGERLFVGESDFSTLEKVRNVEILPPSTYNRKIPDELERIVLKALSKDVEDRYQNAIDLHDELQAFMYSAGEFYSRKDLASWMKSVFSKEIEEETKKLKELQSVPTPAIPAGAGPAAGPPPIPTAGPPVEPAFAANPVGEPDYEDPFDPAGPDLDWDDDEIETQLYDRQQEIEAQVDYRAPDGGEGGDAQLPQFSRPQKPMARRTLMGIGAVSPQPESKAEAAPSPFNSGDMGSPVPYSEPASGRPGPMNAPQMVEEPAPAMNYQDQAGMSPLDAFEMNDPAVGVGSQSDDLEPLAPLEPVVAPDRAVSRQKSGKGLMIGMLVIILLLLATTGTALWYFVFRSTEKGTLIVRAKSVPGIKIYVNGEPLEVEPDVPATVKLEPDIEHTVLAEAPGHKMYQKTFKLSSGANKVLPIVLVPIGAEDDKGGAGVAVGGQGNLKVTTTPPGAMVFLNGQEITTSRTPLQVSELDSGTHKLRIKMPNYFDWPTEGEKTITIEGGKTEQISATLQPKVVMLIVKSDVQRAEVSLYRNGESIVKGKSVPFTHKLRPEKNVEYKVEVKAKNHEVFEKTLDLSGQPEIVLDAELEQKVASTRGRTTRPYQRQYRPRPPTRTEPRVTDKTRDTEKVRPTPPTRPTTRDTATAGGTGTLRINTKPWTKIYVDGSSKGVTPQLNLKLPAGKRRLRLVNKEFNISKSFTVNIKAGQTTTFVRKFK